MAEEGGYNAFSGPLADITGRLTKLRDQINWTRFDANPEEQIPSLLFMTGVLVDLVDQLAQEVVALLPREDNGE